MRRELGRRLLATVVWLAASGVAAALAPAAFSDMQPGQVVPGWRLETLRGRPATTFELVSDHGTTVLEARAEGSVAALFHDLRVEPAAFPRLTWRWKIDGLLQTSDLTSKRGDDYPARIYVTFDVDARRLGLGTRMKLGLARMLYGAKVPTAALCYVWDRDAAPGTIAPNAYTDRVQMIVLRSGPDGVGEWQRETRDVAADYRAAFGEDPPAITSVGVATDTDDTGESALAWFGDLDFGVGPRQPADQ